MSDTGPRQTPPRRLAAVLFADIVGFTPLTAENEARAYQLVTALQASARRAAHGRGRIVRFIGDAVLMEFPSAESAVRAALDLGEGFREASAADGAPGMLHSGVHIGEVVQGEDGDIFGASVNLAARLQTSAAAGELLVSDDVFRQLRSIADLTFDAKGVRTFKGVADPVAVYAVCARSDAAGAAAAYVTARATSYAEPAEPAPLRLIVLPFRLLRPDAEIEFLSFGLADAITATLSGLRSLVVRSSLAAQRYAAGNVDLAEIGRDAAVDLVLAGTLLRAGDRVRVTAQLTDVSTGSVLWSESQQVQLGDLFQLQDELTQRVVASVATPLTARDRRLIRHDVPATAHAYELYLRATAAGGPQRHWHIARGLYRAALDEDPDYAPAWAHLGRCSRLLAKYAGDPAERPPLLAEAAAAFRRALELNPDLPVAHSFLAQFEVEGGQPREGMIRLLERLALARDPNLLAGLVHALRYCGLLEQSVAAHVMARRLDPTITTSIEYTWLVLGRFEEALQATSETNGDVRDSALVSLGRLDEARAWVEVQNRRYADTPFIAAQLFLPAIRAALDHDRTQMLRETADLAAFPDREGRFIGARWLALAGAVDEAVSLIRDLIDGYFCDFTLLNDPWLEAVRAHPELPGLVQRAAEHRERAYTSFVEYHGPELIEGS